MKKLVLITSLTLLAAPALADPGNGNAWGYNGQGQGLHLGHRVDGPLPLAAGLPALALIGGAIGLAHVARKRRQHP